MNNISGSIASGGVAQNLFNPVEPNTANGYYIRNNSAASLWINDVGTATTAAPSLEIKPGEMYETPTNIDVIYYNISIIGGTTG